MFVNSFFEKNQKLANIFYAPSGKIFMQVIFYLRKVNENLKKSIKKPIRSVSATLALIALISSFCMSISFAKSDQREVACSVEYMDASVDKNDDVSIYLLTGIDNAGWNSDVIMLVSISKSLGKIGVLQIPRDSYINIDGKNYHKINAVYSEGCRRAYNAGQRDEQVHSAGSHALSTFLEGSLGVKISGHASVTTSGLSRIVDTIGGIDLNIPTDLSYDDNSQNLHISLKAGPNHLSGDLAVKFVRCRKYVNADYGRMNAQRLFMSAVFKKVKNELSVKSMVELLKCAYQNVNTDIEMSDALSLAKVGLKIDEDNISMENLVGKSVKVGSAYCEVLNAALTREKIRSCLYFDKFGSLQGEFDPDGVFTNKNDENISKIYADKAYFMK